MNVQSLACGTIASVSMRASRARLPPPGASALPSASRNATPSTCASPMPPSVVAEPPRPRIRRRAPCSSAWRISSPVPQLVACNASRSSGRSRGRPEAAAVSTTAVPSGRTPYSAEMGRPSGSCAVIQTFFPPVAATSASTVPSPPSATGIPTVCASGKTLWTPRSIAETASSAEQLPLKESAAMITFISLSHPQRGALPSFDMDSV